MDCIKRAITLLALGAAGFAAADEVVVKEGTDVKLKFVNAFSSKNAKEGDRVMLKVAENLMVNGRMVLKAGMPVTGVIEDVEKRGRFGKNARMRVAINPIKTLGGEMLYVEPRDKGSVTGRRTDTAAAASAGGAVVLGPIGLAAGYFVVGKPVKVKPGATLMTSVSRTTTVDF